MIYAFMDRVGKSAQRIQADTGISLVHSIEGDFVWIRSKALLVYFATLEPRLLLWARETQLCCRGTGTLGLEKLAL